MIIVTVEGCKSCDEVISAFPGYEIIELRKSYKRSNPRTLAVKQALHELKHDGAFPCALRDDLKQLIDTEMLKGIAEEHQPRFTFRRPNTIPPGGKYFFVVRKTNTRIEGGTLGACVHATANHLRANGLPVPSNLPDHVMNQMCRRMPDFCKEIKPLRRRKPRVRLARYQNFTTHEIIERSVRVMEQKKNPNVFVDGEEADERAAICIACDRHMTSICTTCNGLAAVKDRWLPTRKTQHEGNLEVCGVSGILTAAKIHFKNEILPQLDYPSCCWLKQRGDDESGPGSTERVEVRSAAADADRQPESGPGNRVEAAGVGQGESQAASADSGTD